MNFFKKFSLLLFLTVFTVSPIIPSIFIPTVKAAEAPNLLKDINPSTFSSWPHSFTEFSGQVWFGACENDGADCGLYRTNGTANGTENIPLVDEGYTVTSNTAFDFEVFGEEMYFVAEDKDGRQRLWVTDGTLEGTEIVEMLDEFEKPHQLIVHDDYLYFAAVDMNDYSAKVWRTNGLEVSVSVTPDFENVSDDDLWGFTSFGDELFFFAEIENEEYSFTNDSGYQLWHISNSDEEALLVEDFINFSAEPDTFMIMPDSLVVVNGGMYVSVYKDDFESEGFYLYKLEYVEGWEMNQVERLTEQTCSWSDPYDYDDYRLFCSGDNDWSNSPQLTASGNNVFILAYDDTNGYKSMMYDTVNNTLDFTEGGMDWEGIESAYIMYADVTAQQIYYYSEDYIDGDYVYKLYITNFDGQLVSVINTTDSIYWSNAFLDGRLYFQTHREVNEKDEYFFMRVNAGKNGLEEVGQVSVGGQTGSGYNYAVIGNSIYFIGNESIHGEEPWIYTVANGMSMIIDLDDLGKGSSGEESHVKSLNGNVFFSADNDVDGTELWRTDGTSNGTVMVKNIHPEESSYPRNLMSAGNTLYFVADDENGRKLWRSDGTDSATTVVEEIDFEFYDVRSVNDGNILYFAMENGQGDYHVFKVTDNGTVSLVTPAIDDFRSSLFILDHTLYFAADDNGISGIYKLEGDTFSLAHDFEGGYIGNNTIFAGSGMLYYVAQVGDTGGLWRITSSEPTPEFLGDHGFGGGGAVFGKTALVLKQGPYSGGTHDLLLYAVSEGNMPPEDPFMTIDDGDGVNKFIPADDVIYFTVSSGSHNGLYVSDGTAEGTVRIFRDEYSGIPYQFLTVGNDIYFGAYDEIYGYELWKSDGTVEGTNIVMDINTRTYWEDNEDYPGSSDPHSLTLFGTNLFFYARTYEYGYEPWVVRDIDVPNEENNNGGSGGGNNGGSGSSGGGRSGGSRSAVQNTTTFPVTITPTTTRIIFNRNLTLGSSGDDVRELQRFLNAHGYPVAQTGLGSAGNETNLFGGLTRTALTRFQTANNISPATGYFGPVTRDFIMNIINNTDLTTPSVSTSPVSSENIPVRNLDIGMSGNDVKALQLLLISQGYSIPAGATGFFANQTKTALIKYQAANNISPALGFFGEKTRAQMKTLGLTGLWW